MAAESTDEFAAVDSQAPCSSTDAGGKLPHDDRPNVLILMSDQHSKFHLGCTGDPLVRTPNLDRLRQDGLLFSNAYTPAPVCVPARMSFMTTCSPSTNQVWGNQDTLSSAIPTWAHSLGAAGYETTLIGRMHFVGQDQRHGFENRIMGDWQTHVGAPTKGDTPVFQTIPAMTSGQIRQSVEVAGSGITTYQAYDEAVAASTSDWLRARASITPGVASPQPHRRPFAAVAGFVLPHCPFFAPKDLFDHYYDKVGVPALESDTPQPHPVRRWRANRGMTESLTEHQVKVARAAYLGLCEHLDRQIGKVLASLEESGLAQNTLVIYCSDHGEVAGEQPGVWWKSTYFEASVGIPMIARWPGVIEPGRSENGLVSLTDIGATMVELAGGEALPSSEGHSLLACMQGTASVTRTVLFSEHGPQAPWNAVRPWNSASDDHAYEPPSRMVRRGPLKLYRYGNEPAVLHDLDEDPSEVIDFWGDSKYAEVGAELLQLLTDGWDFTEVEQRSQELAAGMSVIKSWARVVEPEHEDAHPPPNVEAVARM